MKFYCGSWVHQGGGSASGLALWSGQRDVCAAHRRGRCWTWDVMGWMISSLLCEYPSHGVIFNCYYCVIHPLWNNCALLCLPSLMDGEFVQWPCENQNTSTEIPPRGSYRTVSAVAFAKAAVLLANNFGVKKVQRNWFGGHSVSLNACLINITDFISSWALFALTASGLPTLVEGWLSVQRALRSLRTSGIVLPGSALRVHPLTRGSNPLLCIHVCFERRSDGGRAGNSASMGLVQFMLTAIDCGFTVWSCGA